MLDIILCDVCPPAGSPIPYASLRSYFKKDPASSWGAYVAGCLLVLARERGLTYPDGISILVCSDVPEGRGALQHTANMSAGNTLAGSARQHYVMAWICMHAMHEAEPRTMMHCGSSAQVSRIVGQSDDKATASRQATA